MSATSERAATTAAALLIGAAIDVAMGQGRRGHGLYLAEHVAHDTLTFAERHDCFDALVSCVVDALGGGDLVEVGERLLLVLAYLLLGNPASVTP